MPRATNAPASRARRKRVIKSAKGYRGRRSKLFRYAKDATMKGKYWAYRDRKTRKRTFRYLWIQRLNAAARANGSIEPLDPQITKSAFAGFAIAIGPIFAFHRCVFGVTKKF